MYLSLQQLQLLTWCTNQAHFHFSHFKILSINFNHVFPKVEIEEILSLARSRNNNSANIRRALALKLWFRCEYQTGRLKYYRRLKTSQFNFGFHNKNFSEKHSWDLTFPMGETEHSWLIQLHQINSYFQLNHDHEIQNRKKTFFFRIQIHFSSTLFQFTHHSGGGEVGAHSDEWRGELWRLSYWNWNENSDSSKRKWKMESFFDLFMRWKVFLFSFLFSGYALLAFTASSK